MIPGSASPMFMGDDGYQIQRSLRFKSSASSYLSRAVTSYGSQQKFTWSGWVKRGKLGATQYIFTSEVSGAGDIAWLYFNSSDQLQFIIDGSANGLVSTALFRDSGSYYHIKVAVDTTQATASNRISIEVNGVAITSFASSTYYTINTNIKINTPAYTPRIGGYSGGGYFDGYLAEVVFVDGEKLSASSFGEFNLTTGNWQAKKYSGTYGANGFYLDFSDNSNTTTLTADKGTNAYSLNLRGTGTNIGTFTSNGGLTSAFDGNTNQDTTSSARISAPTAGYNSAYLGKDWGSGVSKIITYARLVGPNNGGMQGGTAFTFNYKFQGSNDNSTWVDLASGTTTGATLEVVSITGINTTTAYRYHRINFNSNGADNYYITELELYEAGNYGLNSWTSTGVSLTSGTGYDSMLDVPLSSGGAERGNYCTLDPLNSKSGSLSEANLKFSDGAGAPYQAYGTQINPNIALNPGYYFEATMESAYFVGIAPDTKQGAPSVTDRTGVIGYYSNGQKTSASSGFSYGATFSTGDIIGVRFGNGELEFYKNGVSQGVAFSGLTGAYKPAVWAAGSAGAGIFCNFGQRPFSYTPPSGYKSLHTGNLSDPTIRKPNQYFDISLFTGTNANQSIVNSGAMQPDMVWLKSRNNGRSNVIIDSVRGVTKGLVTDGNSPEVTSAGGNDFTSFNTNGFSVGPVNQFGSSNTSGDTIIAWQWKKSVLAGFDIVNYTGNGASNRTIAHSLNAVPSMIITKKRTSGTTEYHWSTYHKSIGDANIWLNQTVGKNTGNWPVAPTSSVFTHAVLDYNNVSGQDYINYLFAEIPGFSKIDSYIGNGSSDGPFIYCGFRPKYLLIKRVDSSADWTVFDSTRSISNKVDDYLSPDSAAAEAVDNVLNVVCDFTSNGFKIRDTWQGMNASGGTIIYYAVAETPFKYALAR